MSLLIKLFKVNEIIAEIKKLNPKKSAGFDSKVLKNLPEKTLIFLTVLFNAILRLSHFPTCKNYNG